MTRVENKDKATGGGGGGGVGRKWNWGEMIRPRELGRNDQG